MEFRLALMLHANDAFEAEGSLRVVDMSVQVWRDGKYITSVDMGPIDTGTWAGTGPSVPLEHWAARAARIMARQLEDNFMERVSNNTLHFLSDYAHVTQVTQAPKQ